MEKIILFNRNFEEIFVKLGGKIDVNAWTTENNFGFNIH